MWKNIYKDYKEDASWQKVKIEPGKGITGCEMHEWNGWQHKQHQYKEPKPGFISKFFSFFKRRR